MSNKLSIFNLYNFILNNFNLFTYLFVILIIGLIIGPILLNVIPLEQKNELVVYLNSFLDGLKKDILFEQDIMKIIWNEIKYILILWIAGLSVIGIPLILFLVFFKGVVLGFTIAFILKELGIKGILLTGVTILPQNLIIIPVIIITSMIGILYSISLISHKQKKFDFKFSFSSYTFFIILMNFFVLIGTLYEIYVIPLLFEKLSYFG